MFFEEGEVATPSSPCSAARVRQHAGRHPHPMGRGRAAGARWIESAAAARASCCKAVHVLQPNTKVVRRICVQTELNNEMASVQSYDDSKGRYSVKLDDDGDVLSLNRRTSSRSCGACD